MTKATASLRRPYRGPGYSRPGIAGIASGLFNGYQDVQKLAPVFSPKISPAEALVRFSRYGAAQKAALEENWI